ncbi:MAG TPA: nuclear transport factor 2 family protein [Solirubrobacteraceae bacterium]|nr:nuclear transport factor 2 family protein [Solirubrobacteraceae bacterium]
MVPDNAEIARRAYAAWNRADLEAFVECYHPDTEIRPFLSDLSGKVYRGREGARHWYEDANEPWDQLLAEPERILGDGDELVILVHARGRGHGSGIEIEAHIVHVVTFEDGTVKRLESFPSEDDARRALGARWP